MNVIHHIAYLIGISIVLISHIVLLFKNPSLNMKIHGYVNLLAVLLIGDYYSYQNGYIN